MTISEAFDNSSKLVPDINEIARETYAGERVCTNQLCAPQRPYLPRKIDPVLHQIRESFPTEPSLPCLFPRRDDLFAPVQDIRNSSSDDLVLALTGARRLRKRDHPFPQQFPQLRRFPDRLSREQSRLAFGDDHGVCPHDGGQDVRPMWGGFWYGHESSSQC